MWGFGRKRLRGQQNSFELQQQGDATALIESWAVPSCCNPNNDLLSVAIRLISSELTNICHVKAANEPPRTESTAEFGASAAYP